MGKRVRDAMKVIRRPKRVGFTLVELMIVVTILGILASVAVPKFASMIRQAHEGATKAGLGTGSAGDTVTCSLVNGNVVCSPNPVMFMMWNGNDPNLGIIWISCFHTDSKGTVWSTY
jgi:prepilin-type N-terminal cleavage/methylation domain-containing protein